jgi:hypothetical protein
MTHPLALLALAAALAPAPEPAEQKVDFTVLGPGYFESNKSGLKGEASYLAFKTSEAFGKVFKSHFVPGGKAKLLPKGAFEKQMVVAVVKRGQETFAYKVAGLTAAGGVLKLRYTSQGRGKGTATFASPLIVALPKGKYTAVEFFDGDKKVGSAKVPE